MAVRVSVDVRVAEAVQLYVMDCANCGVVFGITQEYERRRRRDGHGFACPNGHSNVWRKTEADRLREQLAVEQLRREEWENRALGEERRLAAEKRAHAATRAVATRRARRIAAGLCPYCRRNFPATGEHVRGVHPEHAEHFREAI